MKFIYLSPLLSLFCWLLVSCDQVETLAPVTELSMIEPLPKTGVHRVLQGETLYEIAWQYGLDYRYLAKRNQIYPPYAIFVGQKIYLRGEKPLSTEKMNSKETVMYPVTQTLVKVKPTDQTSDLSIKYSTNNSTHSTKNSTKKTSAFKPLVKDVEPHYLITAWRWPTKKSGAINRISQSGKGVNIYGQLGEPIYAAGPGRVVYAGCGLRGYGNLIILKHNNLYLSAYAHNKSLLVKEGDWVKQGQKIAEMGNTGTNKVMLHFEIRRGGQPLNPSALAY